MGSGATVFTYLMNALPFLMVMALAVVVAILVVRAAGRKPHRLDALEERVDKLERS